MLPFIYNVFLPQNATDSSLSGQLDDLNAQVKDFASRNKDYTLMVAKLFFSDASNQVAEAMAHPLCSQTLHNTALWHIEQPPLASGVKVALQIWMAKGAVMESQGNPSVFAWNGMRLIFETVRPVAENGRADSLFQTEAAFRKHISTLTKRNLTLKDNCHRTWIYVRDVDVNYAGVVAGRNNIFAEEKLTADSHYIASTGIGGYPDSRGSSVGIDFFSVDGLPGDAVKYLNAPDYLNPTIEYGVAFERGTCIDWGAFKTSFISGTASIDNHGECLYRGDVLKQAERLFLNISKLLEDAGQSLYDLKYILVYLRDIADYKPIKQYINDHFPSLPFVILEARVCRPEWLIEVEGIAQS